MQKDVQLSNGSWLYPTPAEHLITLKVLSYFNTSHRMQALGVASIKHKMTGKVVCYHTATAV